MLTRLTALPALVLVLSTLAGCSGDDEGDVATDPEANATTTTTTETVTCDYPEEAAASKEVEKPSADAPKTGEAQATITTNFGEITLTLTRDAAPCTVNSFLSLAEQGYFDGTTCHRLVPEFVLQCGDPSGTGSGGPGYTLPNEVTGSETYTRGVLAMANMGGDAATGGSQFFIMLADSGLPPQYTVFGSVSDEGMKVVDEIAAKGTQGGAPDGPPAETVTIESVTTD